MSGISQVKNKIAIGAGKGGVGKSTITVQLAMALQKKGYQVGILDLDLYGPSIGKMIKIDIIPVCYEDRLLPAEGVQMKLMSIAFFHQGLDANFIRAPIANGLIQQFLHRVEWGALDYLLIDCPPGTSDIHMTLMQEIELTGAVLVSTPQQVALLDVRKALQMFIKMQVPILGLIENMAYLEMEGKCYFPFGKSQLESLTCEYPLPLVKQIPLLSELSEGCDLGVNDFPFSQNLRDHFLDCAEALNKEIEQLPLIPSLELAWQNNWEDL